MGRSLFEQPSDVPRGDEASYCDTLIAPGLRCGHHVQQHVFHGSFLLECWRCEDWHQFMPARGRRAA